MFWLFLKLDFHLVNSRDLRVYFGRFISGNILVETLETKKYIPTSDLHILGWLNTPYDAGFQGWSKKKNQLAKCIKD